MKLKQKQIAKRLGESEALISLILSGKRRVTYRLAKKCKAATKITEFFWMEATPEELKKAFSLLEGK